MVLIKYMGAMGKPAYGIDPKLEKSQWSTTKIIEAWKIDPKEHIFLTLEQLTQLAEEGQLQKLK